MAGMRFSTPRPKPWLADIEAKIGGTSDRPDWVYQPTPGNQVLLLDRNESRDPELAAFIENIIYNLPPTVITDYSEPGPVYRKLARLLDVAPDQIMLASGSEAGIRDVFIAFVEPGDGVLSPVPTYIMAPVYCRHFGASLLAADYVASKEGPLLNVEAFCREIVGKQPRLVYLPNPNSPTGTILESDELRQVIETAGRIGAVMLLDEAYYPFYDFTAVRWLPEYPHLLISRTFSKAWGMAGLRLGVLVGQRGLMAQLTKIRTLNEVSTIASAVLERMLDHQIEVSKSVARLVEGKAGFCEAMSHLGFSVHPGYGNFCLVDFGQATEKVMAAMEGLAVFRATAHPSMLGFQRVTTTTRQRFAPIIARIREAMVVQAGQPVKRR